MVEFRFGPVELYLVGFEGDRPDPGVMQALIDLLDSGRVRLLDFIIVSKSEDGEITVTEVEDEREAYGFADIEIVATGLTGDDDIEEFADLIPPGGSAALVALELAYVRELASKLAASGGVVLRTERIPAPVVNAVIDAAEAGGN
jgi:uncharacterized membrane protein